MSPQLRVDPKSVTPDGAWPVDRLRRTVVLVWAGVSCGLPGLLVTLALLVDQQGEILAARSEAHDGFDPSVFPPFDGAIWVLANGAAALAVAMALCLLVFLLTTRTTRTARTTRR